MSRTLAISVLDLVGTLPGGTAGQAIGRSVTTAQHAEQLGYKRFWLAEHHSIAGLACSATSVLIGHVAGQTNTIRVGSGGIMLPNHAPLVVAEQFGTLASIYPGRIDLGLGRAPGSDGATMRAMRRDLRATGDDFPEQVMELQQYLGAPRPGQMVHAYPGENTHVPITLLGSSGFSAQLAGQLGLPFAFASHFAPDYLEQAIFLYRQNFRPSEMLSEPYVMAGIPVIAADTNAEAKHLFTTPQQRFLALVRNHRIDLPQPVDSMDSLWNAAEQAAVHARLRRAIIGDRDSVRRCLEDLVEELGVDEIFAVTDTYSLDARLRSYEILADAAAEIPVAPAAALA